MFAFPRKNYIDGKQIEAYPDRQLRFFQNNVGIKYHNKIHEVPTNYKFAASPTDAHIIHKKSSARQEEQDKRYEKLAID